MSKGKFLIGLTAVLVSAAVLCAQRKVPSINSETPHGALMQQIAQEGDAAKKVALLDEFLAKFGADPKLKNEVLWAYPQKLDLHVKAKEWDKAIDAGTKAVALDDSYTEVAVATLKAAEAKKDMPAVKAWAARTSAMARKSLATAKLPDEEDEAAKTRIDYSKQVNQYADYALFNAALQGGSAAVTVEMADALKAQSPDSEYWPQLGPHYVFALNSQGQKDKAAAVAEEVVAKDPSNMDLLLLVADYHFGQKPPNSEKVLAYSSKAVAAWDVAKKPDNVAQADWDKKKNDSLSYALWLNGMTLAQQNKLNEAQAPFVKALPMLSNDALKAHAAFYAGLASFKQGEPPAGKPATPAHKAKLTEAYRFFQQCAAIKGPLQGQAASNLKVIAVKYGIK
jgi:tetratricopeptide (TPR) repeat protein